jgi:hypothetical protein
MAAHQGRRRGRLDRRAARSGALQPPRGRDTHPSRCGTIVHDGGDRVDAVSLWLSTPRAVHLGDQVGWPRGGLAPSATYGIRVAAGGYLSVVAGTLVGWLDRPGPGPLLTPSGELDDEVTAAAAANVVPFRRPPATAAPAPGAVSCPCRASAGLRLADEQDAQRERDRARRERAATRAKAAGGAVLLAAVRDDTSVDVEDLITGLQAALESDLAIGPLVQAVAAGVPAEVMAAVLRRLPQTPARSGEAADFRVTYRVLAQRALAVHGAAVLDALPARLVADGMAAQALVRPRLERMLGRPLPGELGRLARWSLHGLDQPLGDVDPLCITIALLAMGVGD